MKMRLIDDWTETRTRANEWTAVAAGAGIEGTFASFEWCDALRLAHYKRGPAPTLIAEEDGELSAVWPLHIDRVNLGNVVPCRRLSDSGGWFVGHNGLICRGDRDAIALEMLAYLRSHLRGWDILEVGRLVEGGASHKALLRACASLDLPVTVAPGERSPYLLLQTDWEAYLQGRKSKFRSALNRNEKALGRMGAVEVRFLHTPEEIRPGLNEVMAIERQSWKHRAGSAITARAWEETFYTAYLPRIAERGVAELAIMTLGGRPIAYDMGVIENNRYSSLKISYVEDMKAAGPGKVMCRHMLRSHMERGLSEYDFLGKDEASKLDWTDTVRPHVTLQIYRSRWYARALDGLRRLKTRFAEDRPVAEA
jgi:CelD/BcsL family acetyltransferase involved in cellulose biosynthesis